MDPTDIAFETLVQGPNGEPGFLFRPWYQCHRTSERDWEQPTQWDARAQALGQRFRVLCGPNSDPFNPDLPASLRADLFRLIAATPHLDWLIITSHIGFAGGMLTAGLSNLWLGVPVASQAEANALIPVLLNTPARIRFVVATMREAIDFTALPLGGPTAVDVSSPGTDSTTRALGKICAPLQRLNAVGQYAWGREGNTLHTAPLDAGLDWVICLGDTGADARPTHPDWVRDLRDQCRVEGVPFLFAQWGEWAPGYGTFADGDICVAISRDSRLAPETVRTSPRRLPSAAAPAVGWSFVHRAGARSSGRRLDGRTHDASPFVAFA